jgi:hypothetical protein
MRTAIDVIVLGLMIVVLAVATTAGTASDVQFRTGVELRQFADSNGLRTHDAGVAKFSNFYIADRPLTDAELVGIGRKDACGLTDDWRGVLWACEIRHGAITLVADCLGGKRRIWGNLVVAGDEELMDRIEQIARDRATRRPS